MTYDEVTCSVCGFRLSFVCQDEDCHVDFNQRAFMDTCVHAGNPLMFGPACPNIRLRLNDRVPAYITLYE